MTWPTASVFASTTRHAPRGESARVLGERRRSCRNPEAMWDAYGWLGDEVPAEVEEETILARLLALNVERASQTRGSGDP
ncbi:MAG TPA: hypothetical protein VGT61_12010 [Thermomicrobiales bacterium]|jgi:hypothetical protein|nr:hypothetical protein [Thermomicrobiales bacterium]